MHATVIAIGHSGGSTRGPGEFQATNERWGQAVDSGKTAAPGERIEPYRLVLSLNAESKAEGCGTEKGTSWRGALRDFCDDDQSFLPIDRLPINYSTTHKHEASEAQ